LERADTHDEGEPLGILASRDKFARGGGSGFRAFEHDDACQKKQRAGRDNADSKDGKARPSKFLLPPALLSPLSHATSSSAATAGTLSKSKKPTTTATSCDVDFDSNPSYAINAKGL
jgi:hypothetical protein